MTNEERLKNLAEDEKALASFNLSPPGHLPGMPEFEQPPNETLPDDGATEGVVSAEVREYLEREGYYEPIRLAQKPRLVLRATGIYYRTSSKSKVESTLGLPDLVILPRSIGLAIMVELKRRKGGGLRRDQEISLPFGVYVVRSAAQMAWLLSRYRALKPTRTQRRSSSWE